jgi:SAM-dependent methyltransferase
MCFLRSYDPIAPEYYDSALHPTCANFGELSKGFLAPRIRAFRRRTNNVLEIGAGRSVVAPVLARQQTSLRGVILLDSSPAMLEHSREWEALGAQLLVEDARNTELPAGAFELIVSSLGDPYNEPAFWREVRRLLAPGGLCFFTTPTPEWAARFRAANEGDYGKAEFVINGGTHLEVPSIIPPSIVQDEMLTASQLQSVETADLFAHMLTGPQSSKLSLRSPDEALPIVRGHVISHARLRERGSHL